MAPKKQVERVGAIHARAVDTSQKEIEQMKPYVVLVAGGRGYAARHKVHAKLNSIARDHPDMVIVSGGASGADTYAAEWDHPHRRATIVFRAQWERHGRGAGFRRNKAMIDYGPDLVLAFAGGRGTADTVRRARAAGIPVDADAGRDGVAQGAMF